MLRWTIKVPVLRIADAWRDCPFSIYLALALLDSERASKWICVRESLRPNVNDGQVDQDGYNAEKSKELLIPRSWFECAREGHVAASEYVGVNKMAARGAARV
jgi:hypothetical protein